jgi:hypothetical protein
MPFCASCGVHCSEHECKADTRGDTEVRGPMAWSRIERVYFCLPCAERRARTSRLLMWIFGLIGILALSCCGLEFFRAISRH